jgi:hypothetical protein
MHIMGRVSLILTNGTDASGEKGLFQTLVVIVGAAGEGGVVMMGGRSKGGGATP